MSYKDLSMEMRVLLAFALSAVVLLVFAPKPKAPPQPAPPKTATARPAMAQAPPPSPPGKPKTAPAARASRKQQAEPPPKQDVKETEITIENDLYLVRFSNRGGVVKKWELKKYKDAKGQPLDLVNHEAAEQVGWPFSVWTDDPALREKLNSALFVAQLSSARAPATLALEFGDGTLAARKEFRFEHGSYIIQVHSEISNVRAPVSHELVWRAGFGDHSVPQAHMSNNVLHASPGKLERETYKKGDSQLGGPFVYAGIEDLFFSAVFMPAATGQETDVSGVATARTFRNDVKPAAGGDAVPLVGVGVGGGTLNQFRVYIGPKDLDILKSVSPDPHADERRRRGEPVATLGELVDFGWFSVIALPLFIALKWIYNHVVPNYGWAIVLITVVINFALFPLKLKSMKSAMKMQKLAPQVKAIQEKYKKYKLNDPKRAQQNQEVMDLYRKHGVNPLGGCLPMVLQIPFLYAFYKVLSLAIEMRHAPWILWIRDLSAPETHWFKVLPLLMIGTMVLLQKMTPQTTTDPMQQRMFTLMPIMFGVMFYNVSSGLVLYWLVGNIVQIAQQWYINRTEMRPALARAT